MLSHLPFSHLILSPITFQYLPSSGILFNSIHHSSHFPSHPIYPHISSHIPSHLPYHPIVTPISSRYHSISDPVSRPISHAICCRFSSKTTPVPFYSHSVSSLHPAYLPSHLSLHRHSHCIFLPNPTPIPSPIPVPMPCQLASHPPSYPISLWFSSAI